MSEATSTFKSPFANLVRDPRDVQAPEGSTNAELLALPQQRTAVHDMKGRLLLLPRTGVIVVPTKMAGAAPTGPDGRAGADGYYCVVVDGSACRREDGRVSYARGGYDVYVSDLELQTAIDLMPTDGEWTASGLHKPTAEALGLGFLTYAGVDSDTVAQVLATTPEPLR